MREEESARRLQRMGQLEQLGFGRLAEGSAGAAVAELQMLLNQKATRLAALPSPLGVVQIMNMGTFTPSTSLLIHELSHVWQAQHHLDPFQFMVNSVASQVEATAANGAARLFD